MNIIVAQQKSAGPKSKRIRSRSILRLDLSAALNKVRAKTFALHLKGKRLHRYIWGSHLLEYGLLLLTHSEQALSTVHEIEERIREISIPDARSIKEEVPPSSEGNEYVTPEDILLELRLDNQILAGFLRSAQLLCQQGSDIVTESLIAVWIDQARRRASALMDATWGD